MSEPKTVAGKGEPSTVAKKTAAKRRPASAAKRKSGSTAKGKSGSTAKGKSGSTAKGKSGSTAKTPSSAKKSATTAPDPGGAPKSTATKEPKARSTVAAKSRPTGAAKAKPTVEAPGKFSARVSTAKAAEHASATARAEDQDRWRQMLHGVVPSVDLGNLDLPVLRIPGPDLPSALASRLSRSALSDLSRPSADEIRLGVVRVLDRVQDNVMMTPLRVHAVVIDLRDGVDRAAQNARRFVIR